MKKGLPHQFNATSPIFSVIQFLITNINHITMYRSDPNLSSGMWCVDHLTASDIDTAVCPTCADITRLRIAYSCPSHECIGGAKSCITSSQCITYKAGAIESIRSACSPLIPASDLAVSTVHNGISCHSIISGISA